MERIETEALQKEMGAQIMSAGADFVGFADVSGANVSIDAYRSTAIALSRRPVESEKTRYYYILCGKGESIGGDA